MVPINIKEDFNYKKLYIETGIFIKRLKQTEDIQSIQNYKHAISLWNKIHDRGPRSSKSVRKIMYKGFLNF